MTPDQALANAISTRMKKEDDKIVVHRTQDVEPIIEANKAHYNAQPETGRYKHDMAHVASIPLMVIEKWMREDKVNILQMGSDEQHKYLMKKLTDPEYRYLTVMPGRI